MERYPGGSTRRAQLARAAVDAERARYGVVTTLLAALGIVPVDAGAVVGIVEHSLTWPGAGMAASAAIWIAVAYRARVYRRM